ncbi:Cytochrome P450 monooxygenase abl2 [Fulvia fulva]|uniref:Cytochrome P450 monooxygenase abl2 n=1 Tax=Passalora fulva TaxID=5499 RepID=A0A9Q8PJZ1_PASFU|nr:Cytochrome P450 monooxygenase abl2 [Fulvia fulva]KAK4611531.1 Cytochrome P450 monooxygenase abl2 [Fulvia fulva]KAK4613081.1 Cytochrome P450 monooxygenase abl2 [Fulvia fulva]UJO23868.1 Cytochrome P450 monooxygenase abl2 [Fulvia fulva]WPV21302.1 Cytochrome P450 monooxygenase abl2 [Fulvia fulva]WPV35954.1 Cytochrome P450 monooxygenase abl2 [Fulvia fulva]
MDTIHSVPLPSTIPLPSTLWATTSLSTILLALFAILGIWITSHIIYRLYFHPLSKYSGPLLNAISSIPAAYQVYAGTQPRTFQALHAKYGHVFRSGPNDLSFCGADAWEDIYGVQKVGPNFQKDPSWLAVVSPKNGQTGVSMAPPETHTRQRNALGATFMNEALLNQEEFIRGHVEKFMEVLRKCAKENRAIDFSHWFTYLSFDVIGEVVFGEPFSCLDDEEHATSWARAINDIFQSGAWEQAFGQAAGVQTWLHRMLVKAFIPEAPKIWRQKHLKQSTEKTMRRLKEGERGHGDIVGHILRNNETKKARLSETELILNMVQFISAGSETTASLFTGWIFYILSSPDAQKKVVEEVRNAFSSPEEISWTSVGKLAYLEATIHEALRLVSPAPCNQHRVVPPGQGKMIDGNYVPPGVTVGVAAGVAERHPDNWTDAEKFVPERWLGAERYQNDKRHASQPFGLGVRACVGKNLSFFEARLMLANLLWNFDLCFDESAEAREAREMGQG